MLNVEVMFMVLFGFLIFAKSEVYIVTVEGDPVISYRGGINGFEATAVESDQKLDVTRLVLLNNTYTCILWFPLQLKCEFDCGFVICFALYSVIRLHRTLNTLRRGTIRFLSHYLKMKRTRKCTATSILSMVLRSACLLNRSQSAHFTSVYPTLIEK